MFDLFFLIDFLSEEANLTYYASFIARFSFGIQLTIFSFLSQFHLNSI